MKFIFAHPMYLRKVQFKLVYESHRVKVTLIRAENIAVILPPLHFSKCMNTTAQTVSALRHPGATCKHDYGKFHASYFYYMHALVGGRP